MLIILYAYSNFDNNNIQGPKVTAVPENQAFSPMCTQPTLSKLSASRPLAKWLMTSGKSRLRPASELPRRSGLRRKPSQQCETGGSDDEH